LLILGLDLDPDPEFDPDPHLFKSLDADPGSAYNECGSETLPLTDGCSVALSNYCICNPYVALHTVVTGTASAIRSFSSGYRYLSLGSVFAN
jgi:hypothetical protein